VVTQRRTLSLIWDKSGFEKERNKKIFAIPGLNIAKGCGGGNDVARNIKNPHLQV
jgi:hypothetical protein